MRKTRNAFSWKERFAYWFDNRMASGSLGLIRFLIAASIILAVVVAALIVVFGFQGEEGAASVFWDSIATVINAWMPSFEDGGPGYLILMSLVAVAGVLFTSVLIGIVTSTIEEKIINLKKGNSRVLEQDHTVILGLYPGEYTLLRQLVLAAAGDRACFVVANWSEREELETSIRENVEVPKNIRIVCRTANLTDPASLEKLSINTCRKVIVSPADGETTVKAVLAVAALGADVPIYAILDRDEYRFPTTIARQRKIFALNTSDILARIIAHSCTQTGLSATFREVFDFNGSEFYLLEMPEAAGLTFAELTCRLDRAVPAGICRDGHVIIDPPADTVIAKGEQILVFSEARNSACLLDEGGAVFAQAVLPSAACAADEAVILGSNETLPIIVRELPENVRRVYLAGSEIEEATVRAAEARSLCLETLDADIATEAGLETVCAKADHIVILNDHEKSEEDADLEAMFWLLRLRDLRERTGAKFNVTAELRSEADQTLVVDGDHTDFVITSSMAAMFLARLSENPELIDVFREILSNDGNELYLKNADALGMTGTHDVRTLRAMALRRGYILLGLVDADLRSTFNPPLTAECTLCVEDQLVVLGRE